MTHRSRTRPVRSPTPPGTADYRQHLEVETPEHVVLDPRREHWMGRVYMRRVSIHLTRLLSTTRVTPDELTWGMLISGLARNVRPDMTVAYRLVAIPAAIIALPTLFAVSLLRQVRARRHRTPLI